MNRQPTGEAGARAPLFVGLNMPSAEGLSNAQVVDSALTAGYDMITCRITSRGYRKRVTKVYEENMDSVDVSGMESPMVNVEAVRQGGYLKCSVPAPEVDEVLLSPGAHVSNTIALGAPWVEIDAKSPALATLSLDVLKHEFRHAAFCGVPYIMINGPKRRTHIAQYAQAVNTLISQSPLLQVIIHLPFNEEPTVAHNGVTVPPPDYLSIWDLWHMIRTVCNYSPNLSVALQVPKDALKPYVVSRWFAEPVSMLIVSPRSFVPNPKQFPVLPKSTQSLLFQFFKKHCFLLLDQQGPSSSEFNGGENAFLIYLRHLHQIAPQPSVAEQFAQGYTDFLQAPLQPLVDNLESATYEVFEKDAVKYNQYEKAVYHAILDRPNTHRLVVAVVGAGRGAIVSRVLKAAQSAGREVKVYAVEKNASAYVYLCQRQRDEWGSGSVQVVQTDMRRWDANISINIIVSELLGSFGDNELSPECLDEVQQFLDPHDGVMIPSAYSSHLTPVMSPKLYTRALATTTTTTSSTNTTNTANGLRPGSTSGSLHVPYVVMMQQVDLVCTSIQQAWRFEHPVGHRLEQNQHNTRHSRNTFSVGRKCVVHGFAGYFEAVLYKDIQLSTCPDQMHRKSPDMVSWFPLWFPLSQPMYMVDDSEVDFSVWRLTDGRKVWYEWCCESFAVVCANSNNTNNNTTTTTTDNGQMSASSSKQSVNGGVATTTRRIRTGASELHNSGGQYFAMTL